VTKAETAAKPAPAAARIAMLHPTSHGRPCCVMAGDVAHDHLRR
jgi:hypothetical protein